jgi:predicted HTH domain antitoxin
LFNMVAVSVTGIRFPEALEKAVDEVVNEESVDKSTAVRLLVDIGYREWRLRKALQGLREGKVSLWKASEMAGMSLWDLLLVVEKEGIEWAEFEAGEFPRSPP